MSWFNKANLGAALRRHVSIRDDLVYHCRYGYMDQASKQCKPDIFRNEEVQHR